MLNSRLTEVLYLGSDIPDVLAKYEALLRDGNPSFEQMAHATKIQEYRNLMTDKKFLRKTRTCFNEMYRFIDTSFPSLHFCIDGRRKSLISTESKILKTLNNQKSVDVIRDLYAFRILLFGENSHDLISLCYQINNNMIEYLYSKGLTLCEAETPKGTEGFKKEDNDGILIPKESETKECFKFGVKDYFISPKKNGYQSLHTTFRTLDGRCFEIQIRTFAMHLHAEDGNARHDLYKAQTYRSGSIQFDPTKVNIPGFGVSLSGKIFDYIGLTVPLEIVKRNKTF